MIYRWTHDTDIIDAVGGLKRTFEDEMPFHHRRLRRFEIQFSPAFERWLVEHPLWRKGVDAYSPGFFPFLSRRRLSGWTLCDCVALVPSTVCQGLARFVGVIDGGRTIRYATIVGGSA